MPRVALRGSTHGVVLVELAQARLDFGRATRVLDAAAVWAAGALCAAELDAAVALVGRGLSRALFAQRSGALVVVVAPDGADLAERLGGRLQREQTGAHAQEANRAPFLVERQCAKGSGEHEAL